VAPDGGRIESAIDGATDGVGKRRGDGFFDEEPCFIRDNRFEGAAARIRDDRPAARLRLERHDAEILFAGKHHHAGAAIEIAHLVVAQPAEKFDVMIFRVASAPLEFARPVG